MKYAIYSNSSEFPVPLPTTRGQSHKLVHLLHQTTWALSPTFEKLFLGALVQCGAQKIGVGCKTVYEMDPDGLECGVCWVPRKSLEALFGPI